jgi:hypothetical protein
MYSVACAKIRPSLSTAKARRYESDEFVNNPWCVADKVAEKSASLHPFECNIVKAL